MSTEKGKSKEERTAKRRETQEEIDFRAEMAKTSRDVYEQGRIDGFLAGFAVGVIVTVICSRASE